MKSILFVFLFFISFNSCFSQKKTTQLDSIRGKLTPERACIDVFYYELSLDISIDTKSIIGNNEIHFLAKNDFTTIQLDLDSNLFILKILDNKDQPLKFTRKKNTFFIEFQQTQKKGTKSFVKIFYSGKPTIAIEPPWEGGFVWTKDSLNRPWVGVACEGAGASLWWPCKDHPSDEPDSMRMNFEVPNNLYCASNGNLTAISQPNVTKKIYHWKVSYPINNYNVTLNIGHYKHFSDTLFRKDNSKLPLDYYILDYNLEKAKKHFQQVNVMLKCYEKLFGNYPYQNDGYALIEASYWGMEHQGGIAYGNKYKNDMLGFDYIIVHESGHEWWGNNISIDDHADLWIHEAFTTYGETLLLELVYNKETAEKYLYSQKNYIKNQEPIIGPYEVNYHYWKDSDMYFKGAQMLHTLRNSINNDSIWFSMLLNIQKTFGGKQLNSATLISYINSYTKFDYSAFFRQYLIQLKLPILEFEFQSKNNKQIQLTYKWVTEEKAFSMPINIKMSGIPKINLNPSNTFQTIDISIPDHKKIIIENLNDYFIQWKQVKSSPIK